LVMDELRLHPQPHGLAALYVNKPALLLDTTERDVASTQ
jgi:hypothetical protein